MKRLLYISLLAIIVSCGEKKATPEELVGNVATVYYQYLLNGNYDAFVDGTYYADTLRPEYRQQLVDNIKMFVAQQKKDHDGITSVMFKEAKIDSANHEAQVFLMLNYGDKNTETVVVPMAEHDNQWYMR